MAMADDYPSPTRPGKPVGTVEEDAPQGKLPYSNRYREAPGVFRTLAPDLSPEDKVEMARRKRREQLDSPEVRGQLSALRTLRPPPGSKD